MLFEYLEEVTYYMFKMLTSDVLSNEMALLCSQFIGSPVEANVPPIIPIAMQSLTTSGEIIVGYNHNRLVLLRLI
jgi:hypothetical protein